jgi:hypothetical protein
MRARDLAGFGSKPGAAAKEPGAADAEPGAAEFDATETGLAACICFGLWRRYAIVNTSTRPQSAVRFPHHRDNVVGSLAERHPLVVRF